MKTKPMEHQKKGLGLLKKNREFFALGCDQGTGKTWMILADAERQYLDRHIDALFIIAPKGVHVNWVRREIPKHMEIENFSLAWRPGRPKYFLRELDRQLRATDRERGLVVHSMNIDAINTKAGLEFALTFLKRFRTYIVIDESQRIKNPDAKRTQKAIEIGEHAITRRIASGTFVTNAPTDIFSQFNFLKNGILGTKSFYAFKAQYAELLPEWHPLVQNIKTRIKSRGTPQVIARDEKGMPKYKNLEKLNELISPYMYRVLKKDCLDLPPKIYTNHYFELSPAQAKLYKQIESERRYLRDSGQIDTFTALTVGNKLRQVTSGFLMLDGQATELVESGPRLEALKEILEDTTEKVIVWAVYTEEIRQIYDMFKKDYKIVKYYGDTSDADREKAIDEFQNGEAQIFLANQAAAGVGLTLTAAHKVIYYSNSHNLEHRTQSEDRAHRIGTDHKVVYIDIVAEGTKDEDIAASLQNKTFTAAVIMGD